MVRSFHSHSLSREYKTEMFLQFLRLNDLLNDMRIWGWTTLSLSISEPPIFLPRLILLNKRTTPVNSALENDPPHPTLPFHKPIRQCPSNEARTQDVLNLRLEE